MVAKLVCPKKATEPSSLTYVASCISLFNSGLQITILQVVSVAPPSYIYKLVYKVAHGRGIQFPSLSPFFGMLLLSFDEFSLFALPLSYQSLHLNNSRFVRQLSFGSCFFLALCFSSNSSLLYFLEFFLCGSPLRLENSSYTFRIDLKDIGNLDRLDQWHLLL